MKFIDTAAEPCTSLILRDGKLVRCGGTEVKYAAGGRQVERRCLARGCTNIRRYDVTIGHAKTKWTLADLAAWWVTVDG